MRLRALRLTAIAHGILKAFALPLDNLSAAAAYSLRKLRTAYTGPAIRVRRSSDNAETDIGFTVAGNLDLNALSVHCQAPLRPLDTVTGSAVAYSTRLIRSAYTGACLRVRRSIDNAETDIGFTAAGDLDTVALLAFVQHGGPGPGNENGFVTVWYDQSGNGRNAVQTTAANQPRIVNAGIVDTYAGTTRPCILATNDLHRLVISSIIGTSFTVGTTSQVWAETGTRDYSTPSYIGGSSLPVWHGALVSSACAFDIPNSLPQFQAGTHYSNGTAFTFASPGSVGDKPISCRTITLNPSVPVTLTPVVFAGILGDPRGFGTRRIDAMWEFVLFSTVLSGTDRELLERSQTTYFGITHANPVSGFVTSWYDQSGNSRNAVQAVAANQPRIVNAGVVETLNGKPALLMASANLSALATITTSTATVCTVTSQPSLMGLLSQHRPFGISGPLEGLKKWFTPASDGSLRYDGGFTAGPALPARALIRTAIRTTISAADWRNGDVGISTVESLPNISGIMSFNPLTTVDTDSICEGILFVSALSTTNRQTLERNQGAAYGITVA